MRHGGQPQRIASRYRAVSLPSLILTARKDGQYVEVVSVLKCTGKTPDEKMQVQILASAQFFISKEWVAHLISPAVSPNVGEPCKNLLLNLQLVRTTRCTMISYCGNNGIKFGVSNATHADVTQLVE